MKALGGLRHARADSINTGWRNLSFRGYADYMQTPLFRTGIGNVDQTRGAEADGDHVREAVPWRCHRSLIADALTVRGYNVRDIMSATRATPHVLTQMARVSGQQVTYPAEVQDAKRKG